MSIYVVTDTDLTSVADAIRARIGGSSQLEFPTEFVSEIGSLIKVSDIQARDQYLFNKVYTVSQDTNIPAGANLVVSGSISGMSQYRLMPKSGSNIDKFMSVTMTSSSITSSDITVDSIGPLYLGAGIAPNVSIKFKNNGSAAAVLKAGDTVTYSVSYLEVYNGL